ncbi:MAG: fatty acid hydroxylase [Myxococcales bacterium]|nr:fatty acid hydroxylase [Myxococcales bacterium]
MLSATPESPRMFESDFIDMFSRIPWYVVPIIYVPMITGFFAYGITGYQIGITEAVMLFAAGYFIWTLTEYWLHRTVFHWVPAASWGPRFHFLLHGVHHDYVNDRLRLVMPPAASLALAAFFLPTYWLILGPLSLPFFAGKTAGYLSYDMIHYYTHHGKPSSGWMKRLRAHHMNHHHNKAKRKYGVSTMFWDHVFRTF